MIGRTIVCIGLTCFASVAQGQAFQLGALVSWSGGSGAVHALQNILVGDHDKRRRSGQHVDRRRWPLPVLVMCVSHPAGATCVALCGSSNLLSGIALLQHCIVDEKTSWVFSLAVTVCCRVLVFVLCLTLLVRATLS